MKRWSLAVLSLCMFVGGVLTSTPCYDTPKCPNSCQPPKCFCSGSEPNMPLKDRPQIVYLTFDDAFTEIAMNNFYREIFEGPNALTNPDNKTIRATHFLSHKYSSYPDAHHYYSNLGHEMASHSITHLANTSYWRTLNEAEWNNEMYGMKQMMHIYGGMKLEDIKGFRAPFLQGGAETMFNALRNKFEFDCSMPSQSYGYVNMENGLWPYTLDYKSIQDCEVAPCPTCQYPGFWIQPMLDLEDERIGLNPSHPEAGMPCPMLDACVVPGAADPNIVKNMLLKSFNRSYYGNTRAPFGVYMHAAWFFGQEWHYKGFKSFLETITTKYDDVWIVPISAGIEYMKNPVSKKDAYNFKPFQSDPANFPKFNCPIVSNCKYRQVNYPNFAIDEIYMKMCGNRCPPSYPWLNNIHGV